MSFLFRTSLAMLFFSLTTIIYMYPADTKSYMRERYDNFYKFAQSTFWPITLILPKMLIASIPVWIIQALGIFIGGAGLIVLLNKRLLIIIYAYALAIPAIILHMPYEGTNTVGQIRKLVFVIGIFFSMMILASLRSESEINEESKKTEEKDK